jgi:hypothetical protein
MINRAEGCRCRRQLATRRLVTLHRNGCPLSVKPGLGLEGQLLGRIRTLIRDGGAVGRPSRSACGRRPCPSILDLCGASGLGRDHRRTASRPNSAVGYVHRRRPTPMRPRSVKGQRKFAGRQGIFRYWVHALGDRAWCDRRGHVKVSRPTSACSGRANQRRPALLASCRRAADAEVGRLLRRYSCSPSASGELAPAT